MSKTRYHILTPNGFLVPGCSSTKGERDVWEKYEKIRGISRAHLIEQGYEVFALPARPLPDAAGAAEGKHEQ